MFEFHNNAIESCKQHQVWFVTGACKGLGQSLVQQLLAKGDRVAATSRNLTDLSASVQGNETLFLPLAVDLKTESQVKDAIAQTIAFRSSCTE